MCIRLVAGNEARADRDTRRTEGEPCPHRLRRCDPSREQNRDADGVNCRLPESEGAQRPHVAARLVPLDDDRVGAGVRSLPCRGHASDHGDEA